MLSRVYQRLTKGKKSAPAADTKTGPTTPDKANPRLSLHLPSPSFSPAYTKSDASDTKSSLWVDVDSSAAMPDTEDETATITSPGLSRQDSHTIKKRLNARIIDVSELMPLLEICCSEIESRGLDTLGIFRPHRLAEKPSRQHSIIHSYLLSIEKNDIASSKATDKHDIFGKPKSPAETYRADISEAGIHDVVAVLKWALRHFVHTPQSSFLDDPKDDWSWYTTFASNESTSSHPANTFSTLFLPLCKDSHKPIFLLVLDLISSIAAHSETNAMNSTRLCQTLGYWLLSSQEPCDNALEVYAEWHRASVALEHIFLSYLREQEAVPLRLQELINRYKGAPRSFDITGEENTLRAVLVMEVNDDKLKELMPGQVFTNVFGADIASSFESTAEGKEMWRQVEEDIKERRKHEVVLGEDALRVMAATSPPEVKKENQPDSPGRRRSSSVDSPTTQKPAFSPTSLPAVQENGGLQTGSPMQLGRLGNRSHSALPKPSDEVAMPSWREFVDSGFSFTGFESSPQDLTLRPEYGAEPASPTSVDRQIKLRKVTPPTSYGRSKTSIDVRSTSPDLLPRRKPGPQSLTVSTVHLDEVFVDLFLDLMGETTLRVSLWPIFEVAEMRPGVVQESRIKFLLVEERRVKIPAAPSADSSAALAKTKDQRKLFATFSRRSSKRLSGLPKPSERAATPKRASSMSSIAAETVKTALTSPVLHSPKSKDRSQTSLPVPSTPDIVLVRPSDPPEEASPDYFPPVSSQQTSSEAEPIKQQISEASPSEHPSAAAGSVDPIPTIATPEQTSGHIEQPGQDAIASPGPHPSSRREDLPTPTDSPEPLNNQVVVPVASPPISIPGSPTKEDVSIIFEPEHEEHEQEDLSFDSLDPDESAMDPNALALDPNASTFAHYSREDAPSMLESLRSDTTLDPVEEQDDEPTTEQLPSVAISAPVSTYSGALPTATQVSEEEDRKPPTAESTPITQTPSSQLNTIPLVSTYGSSPMIREDSGAVPILASSPDVKSETEREAYFDNNAEADVASSPRPEDTKFVTPERPTIMATPSHDNDVFSPIPPIGQPYITPASPSPQQTEFVPAELDGSLQQTSGKQQNRLSQDTVRGSMPESVNDSVSPSNLLATETADTLEIDDTEKIRSIESMVVPQSDDLMEPAILATAPPADSPPVPITEDKIPEVGVPVESPPRQSSGNTGAFSEHLVATPVKAPSSIVGDTPTKSPSNLSVSTADTSAQPATSSPRKSPKIFASAKRILSKTIPRKKSSIKAEDEPPEGPSELQLYSPVGSHSIKSSPSNTAPSSPAAVRVAEAEASSLQPERTISPAPLDHPDSPDAPINTSDSDEDHPRPLSVLPELDETIERPVDWNESQAPNAETAQQPLQDLSSTTLMSPDMPHVSEATQVDEPVLRSTNAQNDAIDSSSAQAIDRAPHSSSSPAEVEAQRPTTPEEQLDTPQKPTMADRMPSLPDAIPLYPTSPTRPVDPVSSHGRTQSVEDPLGNALLSDDNLVSSALAEDTLLQSPTMSQASDLDDDQVSTHTFETSADTVHTVDTTNTGRNSFESAHTSASAQNQP